MHAHRLKERNNALSSELAAVRAQLADREEKLSHESFEKGFIQKQLDMATKIKVCLYLFTCRRAC